MVRTKVPAIKFILNVTLSELPELQGTPFPPSTPSTYIVTNPSFVSSFSSPSRFLGPTDRTTHQPSFGTYCFYLSIHSSPPHRPTRDVSPSRLSTCDVNEDWSHALSYIRDRSPIATNPRCQLVLVSSAGLQFCSPTNPTYSNGEFESFLRLNLKRDGSIPEQHPKLRLNSRKI